MFENTPNFHSTDIRILTHHIYEYKKGLRSIALHTMNREEQEKAEAILKRRGVSYLIKVVSAVRINIFLGDPNCIKIIESFHKDSLSQYSAEQDFMLGIMLGYDKCEQYKRYLEYSEKRKISSK
ncbi:uncharacterized protein DUF2023 [Balneicella halophila]|uniref:Uncharacterized protein DUF2023 n=1 Tax=Balneicella halophila TaxID=1537566 RepID=A0A7L4URD6_BALHA|nr:DUF2023 family protein [Balneicella halophila]PVX52313.1 uncharacterized protein DUF2023 [Balneicella halophila]